MLEKKSKILLPICYIEALERFAFLGFLGIFVFYLMDVGGFSRGEASAISASLGAAIYAFGMFGAYLGDCCLGAKRCLFYGIVFLALGYLALALDFLIIALIFILFGSVFIKSNITSLLSKNFADDTKYTFSIFYLFVNIGCFLGQISSGLLILHSYKLAFLLSFISMFCAILVFFKSTKHIPNEPLRLEFFSQNKYFILLFALFALALTQFELLMISKIISIASIMLLLGFYLFIYKKQKNKSNFKKFALYLLAAVFFYMLIFQGFNTLNILIKSKVSLQLFGYSVPATWYLALMFLTSIATSSVLSRLKLDAASIIALSLIIAALCFIALGALSKNESINALFIIFIYFMLGVFQTCVGVFGLSIVALVSGEEFKSSCMGIWFLCSAAAQGIEGLIARYIDDFSYEVYLSAQGIFVLIIGILIMLLRKYLQIKA